MNEITEYRANRVDVRKTNGDVMLLARTDKGQVVIHLSEHAFQLLVRQTTLSQFPDHEQPPHHSDK